MTIATSQLRDASIAAGTANSGCPAHAIVELLRELLVRQGGCEAHCETQGDFYLTLESADEVSVQSNVNERESGPARRERMKRNELALLRLCLALSRNGGHVFTLFASPRTLALHVRAEETDARDALAHDAPPYRASLIS